LVHRWLFRGLGQSLLAVATPRLLLGVNVHLLPGSYPRRSVLCNASPSPRFAGVDCPAYRRILRCCFLHGLVDTTVRSPKSASRQSQRDTRRSLSGNSGGNIKWLQTKFSSRRRAEILLTSLPLAGRLRVPSALQWTGARLTRHAWTIEETRNLCLVPRFFSTACAMTSPEASLRIGLALFLLGFFVIVPSTNAVQYMSRPKLFGLPFHAAYPITAAIAAGAASGFLMVYAQRMSADVRSWQYLAQLACFGLGVLLFGVAGGCFIGIFTYRRRSSPKTRLNSITGPFVLLHCYGHEFLAFHDRARRLASLGERPK